MFSLVALDMCPLAMINDDLCLLRRQQSFKQEFEYPSYLLPGRIVPQQLYSFPCITVVIGIYLFVYYQFRVVLYNRTSL